MQSFFALVDRVGEAVGAAVRINRALADAQTGIGVGIGIDYGRFLMVPGKDCYGDPVKSPTSWASSRFRLPASRLPSTECFTRGGDAGRWRVMHRITLAGDVPR